MKKLLLMVFALFTINAIFAQTAPSLSNGSVAVSHTMNNTYYINYSQYITEGTFGVDYGIGNVDMEPKTVSIDATYENTVYEVFAREDCTYFKFQPKYELTSGASTFYIKYTVLDIYGMQSNLGTIRVTVNWETNPQTMQFDLCQPL